MKKAYTSLSSLHLTALLASLALPLTACGESLSSQGDETAGLAGASPAEASNVAPAEPAAVEPAADAPAAMAPMAGVQPPAAVAPPGPAPAVAPGVPAEPPAPPAAVDPAAVDPAAVEPPAVEPPAVEPAAPVEPPAAPAEPPPAVDPAAPVEPPVVDPAAPVEPVAAPSGNGELLPQEGNPVHARFDLYKDFVGKEDIVLSFQTSAGGWTKNQDYDSPGNGGGDATFDNGATTAELTLMADAYKRTGEMKYLESARKGMDYILEAQYPSGGWPQFYPLEGGYKNHVTFNDDAMSRVVVMLQYAVDKKAPFDSDVFPDDYGPKIQQALDKAVEYILKAQYVQNGKKTVWCAQHNKDSYEPAHARSYEYPTLSGSESVEVIGFLMTQPQTAEVKEAVIAAVDWFRSPDTYLADYHYNRDTNYFEPMEGSRAWARFYDLETNLPAFSNYDEPLYVGLEHQKKRKTGYRWGGDWGEKIISYAESVGY